MCVLKVWAVTALVCIGLLAATAFPVKAQEAAGPPQSVEPVKGYDDWHFSGSLGLWGPAFQGDVTAKGRTSSVDVTVIDELQNLSLLDFAMDGRFEVDKGPWGFLMDVFYVRASESATGQQSFKIPILDLPPFTIQGRADVTGEYSVSDAALSYDVYASPCLVANMPEVTIGVLGGARYTYIRTKVNLEVDLPLRTVALEADNSKGWVDPFVGGRVVWRLGEKWLTSLRTDFGGFGVSSDFMYNIDLEAVYKINKCFFANAGFRALYTDYQTGSGNGEFKYKMWNYGPVVGVGMEF